LKDDAKSESYVDSKQDEEAEDYLEFTDDKSDFSDTSEEDLGLTEDITLPSFKTES